MRESLGPGYDLGYFGWRGLVPRPDNCRITDNNVADLEIQLRELRARARANNFAGVEDVCTTMQNYHAGGHNAVARCDNTNLGVMLYAEVSGESNALNKK